MTTGSPLSALLSLLFLIVAFFYLFRLVGCRTQLHPFDAENDVGYGLMAIGMTFMLAPTDWLSPYIIRWYIILFALFALWFIGRLFTRKPLLALVRHLSEAHSTLRADALHVLMHGGMCYMFLLMSSMVLSMMQPAIYTSYAFFSLFCLARPFLWERDVERSSGSKERLAAMWCKPCSYSHEWDDVLDVSRNDLHDDEHGKRVIPGSFFPVHTFQVDTSVFAIAWTIGLRANFPVKKRE